MPFAWVLAGLLPSAILAAAAGGYAGVHVCASMRSTEGSARRRLAKRATALSWLVVGLAAAPIGAAVALLFGRIGSDTWLLPLRCFALHATPIEWFGSDITREVAGQGALTGAATASVCALCLRWGGRLRASEDEASGGDRGLFWCGSSCLAAAVLWSAANESIGVHVFGSHDACSPDIGIVALGGYALATVAFGCALSRGVDSSRATRAVLAGIGLAISATTGAAQVSRDVALARAAGDAACGCRREGSPARVR